MKNFDVLSLLSSVIVLSVRTDRLWDSSYLSRHKLHYGGMLLLVLVSWCPQVKCQLI